MTEQDAVKQKIDRIIEVFLKSDTEIRPHFILTGPSGSGKSHLLKQISEQNEVNYFEINAAQLTKEGMSGNSLSKALTPLINAQGRPTLCFVDEFDKLFISGNNNEIAHEVTTGVQNEFLRCLEAEKTSVFHDYGKYLQVDVDNVLFVFAGAFNGVPDIDLDTLRDFGVKTEFLGRVPLVFNLPRPSLDSLRYILDNSPLFHMYADLFDCDKKKQKEIKEQIMEVVADTFENNTLGVRVLHALINQYFINDGEITEKEAEQVTFQKKIKMKLSKG